MFHHLWQPARAPPLSPPPTTPNSDKEEVVVVESTAGRPSRAAIAKP